MGNDRDIGAVPQMPAFFRDWRKWAGLTQEQLAEKMGMAAANVSRYETGEYEWNKSYIEKFVHAVGCPNPWDPIAGPPGSMPPIYPILQCLQPKRRRQLDIIIESFADDD